MVGSAASIAGGMIGDWIHDWATTQWSANQTRSNMLNQQAYNQNMFSSRYQMTMKDMKAAGLNPILAYQQGGGSPASAAALSAPSRRGGSSALDAIRLNQDIKNMKATEALLNSQKNKTDAETRITNANLAEAQTREALYDMLKTGVQNFSNSANDLVDMYKQDNLGLGDIIRAFFTGSPSPVSNTPKPQLDRPRYKVPPRPKK